MSKGLKSKIHLHDLRHIYSALFLNLLGLRNHSHHARSSTDADTLDSLARWHEEPNGNNTKQQEQNIKMG